jgi:hypothetical protein
MPISAERSLNLVEALAFVTFVAIYIWLLQLKYKYSWIVFLVWLLTSFFLHKDTPKTLGWRADNLWPTGKQAAAFFFPCILLLCIVGILLGGLHRSSEHLLVPQKFFGYMSFCLLQQVGLSSYVTNRLLVATTNPMHAAIIAGALFGALHWPNPVLVPVTWLGGTAMSWLFARQRNILPLAIFQGIVGTLVWWAFPVVWHHGMRVGPGFYSFHPR